MIRFILLLFLFLGSTPIFAQNTALAMQFPPPPLPQNATDAQMQMNQNPPKNRLATAHGVWKAIQRFLSLPNVWTKKQTLQEGANFGRNLSPTLGDMWQEGGEFWVHTANGAARVLTSRTGGGFGTVAFVSTAGNDAAGTVGSSLYPFKTAQAAINALPTNGTLCFLPGEHAANVVLGKSLRVVLDNANVRGTWNMTGYSTVDSLYFVGIGNAGLYSSSNLFDDFKGYAGDIVLDSLKVECANFCFRRTAHEGGRVYLKNSRVSAGTFMEGLFYGGGAINSIIKTSQGRGFALTGAQNTVYIRNTFIETMGACMQVVGGNDFASFDIENATLISENGWCAQASNYAGLPCQSRAVDSLFIANGTHSALMGAGNTAAMGGDLSLQNVKLVNNMRDVPNIVGFLGRTEFFYTLGNRALPAATVSLASFGEVDMAILPKTPPMV